MSYTTNAGPSLRTCPDCRLFFPPDSNVWSSSMGKCRSCSLNLPPSHPLHIPLPNAHPNHVAQGTRYCHMCNKLVANTVHAWDPTVGQCRACSMEQIEADAQERAFVVLDAEEAARAEEDAENEEEEIDQQLPRIVIPMAGKDCTLCREWWPSRSYAVVGVVGLSDRCRSCRKREMCTGCNKLKKRHQFERPPTSKATSLFRTCAKCRGYTTNRQRKMRQNALDNGQHWCQLGRHNVSIAERTAPNGTVFQNCQVCLARRRTALRTSRNHEEQSEDDGLVPDENDGGVHSGPLEDEYDAVFGDGTEFAEIDLPEDSAVTPTEAECLKRFDAALEEIQLARCGCCREEGFHVKIKTPGMCARCDNDKNDVRLWSDENNVNPMPDDEVPACLKGLTDVEQQLIQRVKPVAQVRWTSGGQLKYKDHIINFRQNIADVAERLPRLPEDLDWVVIRRDGVNLEGHVDFQVRRDRVRQALQYKIQHDSAYTDLGAPDEAMLAQLPEDGSVATRIPTCREGVQAEGGNTAIPTGPTEAAGPVAEQDGDGDDVVVGGVIDIGGGSREEVVEVREGAETIVRGPTVYDQTILQAPGLDPSPLSESTRGYIAMAFPTLFPDGVGDFHQNRARKVGFGDYIQHLMHFEGGRFARHRIFPWFAFNTLQRQRTSSQAKIFVKQSHDAGRLSVAELKALLEQGDQHITNNMIRYGAKLRGTRAYWLARRNELTDMIRLIGAPHIFFTLSAADLQWLDLHRHMPRECPTPPGDDKAARRQRRLALERNPHLAATYLDLRVQALMKHVLGPLFKVKDFWYRYEWQERGSGHVHGFLWVDGAPNVDDIDWNLLKSDVAIPEDQQAKMDAFSNYWKQFVTAMNPIPRDDENTPLLGPHPCNKPRSEMQNTREELADLLNWVERHTTCKPGYCLVKRKVAGQQEPQLSCRFDYPMDHRDTAGVGHDSKKRVRFEPQRNDRLLNSYNPAMILAWRANIDFKPVMSTDAARNYIAKYASKAEEQAPAFPALLSSIVSQMSENGTAKTACQKLLNKMLGERAYSAQETAHLLLGIPLVRTSVSFQTLNLAAEGGIRELQTDDAEDSASTDERRVTGDSWIQRYMNRASVLSELSMQQVFEGYTWVKGQWRKRRASTKVVLRTFPRISPDPDGDQYEVYCRTKVILHHAFRDLAEVQQVDGETKTWAELWAQCCAAEHVHPKDTLRCWEQENRNRQEEEDDDEEVPNVGAAERQEDWQVWAQAFPNAPNPHFDPGDIGTRPIDDAWNLEAAHDGRWANIELMNTWLDEKKKEAGSNTMPDQNPDPVDILALAPEQRQIFDVFVSTYWHILADRPPAQALLQVDGSAGCGKTFLIHAICQGLRDDWVALHASDTFLSRTFLFCRFLIVSTMFYTRSEQTLRVGYWYMTSGTSQIISGFVSFGCLHIQTSGFEPWRWLMIITGSLTIVTAISFWLFFPDSPTTAWFLTPQERAIAVMRLKENQTGVENKSFKKEQMIEALTDPKTWLFVLFAGLDNVPKSLSNQISIIISSFGFTVLQTTLLGCVTGAIETMTIWTGAMISTRTGSRAWVAVFYLMPNILGPILLTNLPWGNKVGLLFSVWLMSFGMASFAIALSWISAITAGHTKRVTTNAIVLGAYCVGNALGPLMWEAKYKPRNRIPWTVTAVCYAASMLILLVIRSMLIRENKRRDEDSPVEDGYDKIFIQRLAEDGSGDLETVKVDKELLDLTDVQNRDFRYVY